MGAQGVQWVLPTALKELGSSSDERDAGKRQMKPANPSPGHSFPFFRMGDAKFSG